MSEFSLITARQLAVHAANEAVNDDVMLRADQQEIDNILANVIRIAQNTQYGSKTLLDGSKGATGVVSGANLSSWVPHRRPKLRCDWLRSEYRPGISTCTGHWHNGPYQ